MKLMRLLKRNRYILGLTTLFFLSIMLNELDQTPRLTMIMMFILSILAGYHIFWKAIMDLRYKIVGIDLLVTIAVVAAWIIGDHFEAAAVTYLFTLGHMLEKKSLEKTRSALKMLMDLRPSMARVIKDNQEFMIPQQNVHQGDILLVKPGEKIPTDGEIIEGLIMVDEQMMTGESMPVEKRTGDHIFGSTIVQSGYLKMVATHVGDDVMLAKMIHMVEKAQDQKAKTQKFMDTFSKYYTPFVVFLAFLIFIITNNIKLAITMLVIACPGALVIATPVSFVAGIGNAAKKGILFKGGDSVERLASIETVFFDKTGTLTEGKPFLQEIISFGIGENDLLHLAAIGESYSEHPLASAIIEEARKRKLNLNEKPDALDMVVGKGIQFVYNGSEYQIGHVRFMKGDIPNTIVNHIESLENKGLTTLVMAKDDQIIGLLGIADQIREHTENLIPQLKSLGIKKTIMLTGDRKVVAQSIGKKLAIDTIHANLLPEDKASIIQSYQLTQNTLFVGDGINDALALSYANASVAVGGLGKDLAMETADVVLMGNDLSKLIDAIKISRKVKKNMKQNIAFALIVVAFLLFGVIFRSMTMSVGMLVHEISVLIVLLNAIRLLRYDLGGQYAKKSRAQSMYKRSPNL